MIDKNNLTNNYQSSFSELGYGCVAAAVANYLSQNGIFENKIKDNLKKSVKENLIDYLGNLTSTDYAELPNKLEKILGENEFDVSFFAGDKNKELTKKNYKIKTLDNDGEIPSNKLFIGYSILNEGKSGHVFLFEKNEKGLRFIDSDGIEYTQEGFHHELNAYFEINKKEFAEIGKKENKPKILKWQQMIQDMHGDIQKNYHPDTAQIIQSSIDNKLKNVESLKNHYGKFGMEYNSKLN
jgi:hypothetical protein